MDKKDKKQDIDEALMMLRHKITEMLHVEAKKLGYSLAHFDILIYIAENGNVTMKDIANWMHITPPSASSLIEKLVKKRLVRRTQNSNDRRNIYITLGGEAHKLFKILQKKKEDIFKKMFIRLDNREKEELVRIISKCIN